MSDFPIADIFENVITNLEGIDSYFYELHPKDIEMLDGNQFNSYLSEITNFFTISTAKFFKIFSNERGIFLESDSPVDFMNCTPNKNPLFSVLGHDDFFQNVRSSCDYLKINHEYLRLITISDIKGDLTPNTLASLGNFAVTLKKRETLKAKTDLERIRHSHYSNLFNKRADHESNSAYREANDLLEGVISGAESIFDIEITFLVTETNEVALAYQSDFLCTKINQLGMSPVICANSLSRRDTTLTSRFVSLIPGASPFLLSLTAPSSFLPAILPITSESLDKLGPRFLSQSGTALYFDFISKARSNRNVLITGASGSGKSVLANKIIYHYADSTRFVVIDKRASFLKNCDYAGGTKLQGKFNPFQFKSASFLKRFILACLDPGELSKKEEGLLFSEIERLLPASKSFSELISSLDQKLPGISYYFSELLPHFDNSILKSDFCYLDVENLPKNLIAPAFIFLIEYFKNLPKDKERILVIDEFYAGLRDHASLIDDEVRMIRKEGGSIVLISQNVEDFPESIWNNAAIKVFFPQASSSERLSNFDISAIETLRSSRSNTPKVTDLSEFYLKTEDESVRKILRNELSTEELELFHTHPGIDPLIKFTTEHAHMFRDKSEAISHYLDFKTGRHT